MNMTKYLDSTYPFLSPKDTGEEALELMSELKTRHLPVVHKGEYMGVISEEDIVLIAYENTLEESKAEYKKISLGLQNHFVEAIGLLAEHSLSLLPIVGANWEYIGVIKEMDAIKGINEAMAMTEYGATILIEMQQYQYSLLEIAQIFESEGVRIMFLTVTSKEEEPAIIQIQIKTNQPNLTTVVAALERYEYNIIQMGEEESYTESIKTRYDQLMNYLNV